MRIDAEDGLMPLYDRALSDRDRARDIAVALEGQVAAVRAVLDTSAPSARESGMVARVLYDRVRAALDPDPAEEA